MTVIILVNLNMVGLIWNKEFHPTNEYGLY